MLVAPVAIVSRAGPIAVLLVLLLILWAYYRFRRR